VKARNRRTIKAVFAAEGFSKWMTADFEGPFSSKSIFEILDITDQGNAERDIYEFHDTFRKNWQVTIDRTTQITVNVTGDIREKIMKLLLRC
jgi:hypothetical protein